MPWTEQEQRARVSTFTVSVGGDVGEHQLLGLTNPERSVETRDWSPSSRSDWIQLAGHLNTNTITLREAPIAGCLGEPVGNFLFEVRIGSAATPVAHCRRISGLGVRWDAMDNRESNSLATQKLWDKRRYNQVTHDVVIEWTEGWQLYDYVKKLGEFSGPGRAFSTVEGATCDHVQDIIIAALSNDGSESAKWILRQAWPVSYRAISDLASDNADVGLSSVTWTVANTMGTPGIEEQIIRPLGKNQMVSQAFYDWVAAAYEMPQRKDLIINMYLPGLQPGRDAPVGRLKLFNCWVQEINYQDFDASRDEHLTRELTVQFDGLLPL